MGKVINQRTLDQTGQVIETWAYVDDKGKPRFCTTNKFVWIAFCKSAGINYIERLEK